MPETQPSTTTRPAGRRIAANIDRWTQRLAEYDPIIHRAVTGGRVPHANRKSA